MPTLSAFLMRSAVLLLVACAPTDGAAPTRSPTKASSGSSAALDPSAPGTPPSACDAVRAGFAVGKAYSDGLAEQARQATGSRLVRRLMPGQVVTMEFNAERLNIETSANGRVTAVRCG